MTTWPQTPPSVSPEQVRRMVEEILADPEIARRFLRPLTGTVFAIQGGMACPTVNATGTKTDNKLTKWSSSSACTITDSIMAESSGKIGIGTATPDFILTLQATIANEGKVLKHYRSDGSPLFAIRIGAPPGPYSINYEGLAAPGGLEATPVHTFTTYNDANSALLDRLTILKNGNVGIGTISPTALLHLHASSSTIQRFSRGTHPVVGFEIGASTTIDFGLYDYTNGKYYWRAWQGNLLLMESSGNVGIGTTSPADKLTVSEGRIRSEATGDVRNLVLNQLGSSHKRTQISFQQQGVEQYLAGVDFLGSNIRNFFLFDSVSAKQILLFLSPRGGSNDDAAQIQAAIDNLPSNGGIIMLTPGIYNIGNKISLTKNGVKLRGYGGADSASFAADNPLTKLLWTGSANGTVIELKPSTTNTQIQDIELSDLSIDGATSSSAGIGLLLDRVINSKFISIRVRNCTGSPGTGIKLTTTANGNAEPPNGGNNIGTSVNHFENCSIINCTTGLHLTSETTPSNDPALANTCHNTFVGLNIQGGNVVTGIKLEKCDNNSFYRTLTPGDATTSPPRIGVLVVNPDVASNNYFYHLQAGGHDFGLKIENADGTPASKNLVFGYDLGNGEQVPKAFNGGTEVTATDYLYWVDSNGVVHS